MSDIPKLHVFFPALGMPDPSPFPLKVVAFMRLHGIEYESVKGDVRKAPVGKIPYMEHKGKQIPDSECILNYLEAEYGIEKDLLTAEQHAQGHMICRTLEERLYWVVVYSRWLEDANWPTMRELIFSEVPGFMRGFIGNMVRKDIGKSLWRHGISRHSPEQMYDFAKEDLQALSALLGEKDYLFGDQPTKYDCTALAFVGQCQQTELPTAISKMLDDLPNLKSYWERGKERFFSEPI